jgi:hypothetical protein
MVGVGVTDGNPEPTVTRELEPASLRIDQSLSPDLHHVITI